MLQLKNIKKVYVTSSERVEALKGVSLSFRKREFVSILGPSGCGKTTLGRTVLRLYECKNMRSKTELTLGFPAKSCYLCDMLENEEKELPIKDGKVKLDIRGFEIVTLKLK